jgi:hypothetical protein
MENLGYSEAKAVAIRIAAARDRRQAAVELAALKLDAPTWRDDPEDTRRTRTPRDYLREPRRHWPLAMQAAYAGDEPGDALPTDQRHALVVVLHGEGYTDIDIAIRLRLTTYTATRIREALELPPVDAHWIWAARAGAIA